MVGESNNYNYNLQKILIIIGIWRKIYILFWLTQIRHQIVCVFRESRDGFTYFMPLCRLTRHKKASVLIILIGSPSGWPSDLSTIQRPSTQHHIFFYLSGTKLFPENLALWKQHSDWCLLIGTKSFFTSQMDFEDKFFH